MTIFTMSKDDPKGAMDEFIGPRYEYDKKIRTPEEMGMSGSGRAISKNIRGITGYVQVLFAGGGRASKIYGAMGNQQFVDTGANCKDVDSGEEVSRSIYINNIPIEKTLIASGMNAAFGDAKGLVPGIINNITNINPLGIFSSFMSGTTPDCKLIELPIKKTNGLSSKESKYLTITDIKNLSPCLFPNNTNPITNTRASCLDGFNNIQYENIDNDIEIINKIFDNYNNKNYFKNSDIVSYIYLTILLILFISLIKK